LFIKRGTAQNSIINGIKVYGKNGIDGTMNHWIKIRTNIEKTLITTCCVCKNLFKKQEKNNRHSISIG